MTEYMKAWQQAAPGLLDQNLKLVDTISRPSGTSLQAGEILVQVASACVNPADYKTVEMGIAARAMLTFPKTLGMDLSGTIAAVANGVTDAVVGDRVMVRVDPTKSPGSLSEYVVVPRDGWAVLPQGVDLDLAAGAPTTAMTAYQSIKPYVKAGDKIFINGGSGGAGTFGIQIGKALGCHVTTSCSTAKVALCQKLGADEIIDYRTSDVVAKLKEAGQVFSLVVDNVGNSPPDFFSTTPDFLKPEGHFIGVGGSPSLSMAKNVMGAMLRPTCLGGVDRKFVLYLTKNKHEDMAQLAAWLGDGTLTTIVDSRYDFEQTLEAYAHLKKGSSAGKVIVHVAPKGKE